MLGTATLLMVAVPLEAESPAHSFYYYYQHSSRALTLETSRVAVFQADFAARSSLNAALLGTGLTDSAPQYMQVPGWSLVSVPPALQAPATVVARIESLTRQPGIDFVSPVFIGDDGGPLIVTPTLLIRFDPTTPERQTDQVLANANAGTILNRHWAGMKNAFRIATGLRSGIDVLNKANALAARPDVLFAEPDMLFTGRGTLIPNDTGFANCWGLHNTGQSGGTVDMDMDAAEAWDLSTGNASILVVVIDTGVEQTHPDLNQIAGTDVTSDAGGGGPVNACDNHGTAVAGCVSAKINNSLGTVGVAPGCRSASARTFISNTPTCNGTWTSFSSWTVDSLNWAQSIGARVTNNSNYYGFQSGAIASKYSDTRDAGIVHFASAGNDASSTITYPASLSTVNAVAALTRTGTLASFSNFGTGLDFSAPGLSIYTTDRTGTAGYGSGDYSTESGTSFASPYTAGIAALVLSRFPALTAAQVELVMQLSAVDLGSNGYDTTFGWGFVNAHRALIDCDTNASPDVLDRSTNPARDCNTNATIDVCDTIGGAGDCDLNRTPDVCEPRDCNSNNTFDGCDVLVFGSTAPTNAGAVLIPDSGSASSTLNATAMQAIADVNVQIRIAHSAVGQLSVALAHHGVTVTLVSGVGGAGDNFTNTLFDQQAANSITAGTPPFSNTFRPTGNLGDFNGILKQGLWTLRASDTAASETGTILSWTLFMYHRLTPDCNTDSVPDACQLTLGDCNTNGSLDHCETTGGVTDCNTNRTPDACELSGNDCNTNSLPDACDADANSNNTPDACECPTCPSDVNGDNRVDAADIRCFVHCFVGAAPHAGCPNCGCAERADGTPGFSAADPAAFVAKLLGTGDPNGPPCP